MRYLLITSIFLLIYVAFTGCFRKADDLELSPFDVYSTEKFIEMDSIVLRQAGVGVYQAFAYPSFRYDLVPENYDIDKFTVRFFWSNSYISDFPLSELPNPRRGVLYSGQSKKFQFQLRYEEEVAIINHYWVEAP